jgi:NitT/TauT family transport system substrate-binding protein
MKKLTAIVCALTLLLTGCGVTKTAQKTADPVDVNIMALKGPTAMGMVDFMSQVDSGEIMDNNYNFEIAASIDEVTPKIVQGAVDIAAVPANVASVLYNNTDGDVEVLAINTLGVLYIVESGNSVESVADLKGKTIYASGKGATPEYALNYILSENGIDPETDVTIEWKSEHAECLSALMAEDNAIAMLPQPFVTTAQTKSDNINVVLDLTEEWDKLQEGSDSPSALLTGVVVARTQFIEENPDVVSAFLDHYKESVDFVNSNTDEAAELIGSYDIVTAEIAKKALPACNITFIEGDEMQEKLSGYLNVLFEQNASAVGGALPSDDFYYSR